MKKVLIISTSLRGKSNSEHLAHMFEKGAKDAGNDVSFVSLKDKRIEFCKGCLACQKTGKCVISDDAGDIAKKVQSSDVVVFATPIYYYGMSGQMKTLLDRMNCIYPFEYKFREIYLITSAADDSESTSEKTVTGLQGWLDCFEKAHISGVISANGVNDPGEAEEHTDICDKAYKAGKAV